MRSISCLPLSFFSTLSLALQFMKRLGALWRRGEALVVSPSWSDASVSTRAHILLSMLPRQMRSLPTAEPVCASTQDAFASFVSRVQQTPNRTAEFVAQLANGKSFETVCSLLRHPLPEEPRAALAEVIGSWCSSSALLSSSSHLNIFAECCAVGDVSLRFSSPLFQAVTLALSPKTAALVAPGVTPQTESAEAALQRASVLLWFHVACRQPVPSKLLDDVHEHLAARRGSCVAQLSSCVTALFCVVCDSSRSMFLKASDQQKVSVDTLASLVGELAFYCWSRDEGRWFVDFADVVARCGERVSPSFVESWWNHCFPYIVAPYSEVSAMKVFYAMRIGRENRRRCSAVEERLWSRLQSMSSASDVCDIAAASVAFPMVISDAAANGIADRLLEMLLPPRAEECATSLINLGALLLSVRRLLVSATGKDTALDALQRAVVQLLAADAMLTLSRIPSNIICHVLLLAASSPADGLFVAVRDAIASGDVQWCAELRDVLEMVMRETPADGDIRMRCTLRSLQWIQVADLAGLDRYSNKELRKSVNRALVLNPNEADLYHSVASRILAQLDKQNFVEGQSLVEMIDAVVAQPTREQCCEVAAQIASSPTLNVTRASYVIKMLEGCGALAAAWAPYLFVRAWKGDVGFLHDLPLSALMALLEAVASAPATEVSPAIECSLLGFIHEKVSAGLQHHAPEEANAKNLVAVLIFLEKLYNGRHGALLAAGGARMIQTIAAALHQQRGDMDARLAALAHTVLLLLPPTLVEHPELFPERYQPSSATEN